MNQTVHYLGLDVHKDLRRLGSAEKNVQSTGRRPSERERTSPTIAVSIAPAHRTEVRRYGSINGSLDAVDKLVKKLALPGLELRVVYEAGACGFVICRHLRAKGIACEVVAPSLIPKKASDKVKTDRRDADQLARLHRAGELTSIHIPDQEDLVREREEGVEPGRSDRADHLPIRSGVRIPFSPFLQKPGLTPFGKLAKFDFIPPPAFWSEHFLATDFLGERLRARGQFLHHGVGKFPLCGKRPVNGQAHALFVTTERTSLKPAVPGADGQWC